MTLDKYHWHFYVALVVFIEIRDIRSVGPSHTVSFLRKLSESEVRNKSDLKMSHWQRTPTTLVKLSKRNAWLPVYSLAFVVNICSMKSKHLGNLSQNTQMYYILDALSFSCALWFIQNCPFYRQSRWFCRWMTLDNYHRCFYFALKVLIGIHHIRSDHCWNSKN